MVMTNTEITATLTSQQAITVLTTLSIGIARADAISPLWVTLVDQLIDLGLAGEFDNGPDAVRVFYATDAGRLALAKAHQAARDTMGAILFDAATA